MRFEQHPVTFDPLLVFPWGHVHTTTCPTRHWRR